MKAPGFFRATWVLAAKDLRLEWRTLETLSSSLVFSLVVLVVFSFAFGASAAREFGVERLVPGVLWIVLSFACVVTLSRAMQIERHRETLTAVFLSPVDRSAVYTGKLVANLVRITLLQWAVLPLAAVFFNFDLIAIAPAMFVVMAVHGFGLTVLGTLFAAVTVRLRRGEALLATLLLPASAPLLISAVKCSATVLERKPLSSSFQWLGMTGGFDMLYLVIALATFELALEE